MTGTTFKYNPSQQSREELEQTFVGRWQLLEGILSDLANQPEGTSRQHYVIIGPRGIGKTNLLLMIYHAVKNRSELAEKWVPVQLPEESYSVLNLADFLLEVIRALSAEVSGLEDQIRDISAGGDDQAVVDLSLDLLRGVAVTHKKAILLLVDNLDMILQHEIRDEMEIHRLRSALMSEDFLTIIGTSPTVFDELTNYESPLYNFFKIINLKELSSEESEELIARHLRMEGKPDQAETLTRYRARVKAITRLTGGNPRLLLMVYQMCEHGEIPEVRRALETLLDELTPYFKHRAESLAPQMRKVLDALARSDSNLTPTEIAREARLDVKQVSVQLTRMKEGGLVTAARARGRRNAYYGITERLFRIWYKMRLSRKDRNEAYFFVEFLQAWYEAEEMMDLVTGLSSRFKDILAGGDHDNARQLLESLHIVKLASKDARVAATATLQEYSMLKDLGRPAEAADRLEELVAVANGQAPVDVLAILSDLRMSAGQWRDALRYAEATFDALETERKLEIRSLWAGKSLNVVGAFPTPSYAPLLVYTVGKVLGASHRDVAAVCAILTDMGPAADPWLCFGWWLCWLGQFEAASTAYGTAEEKARSAGDRQFAQIASTSRAACRVLAQRVQLAAASPSQAPTLVSLDAQQEARISAVAVVLAHTWWAAELGTCGFGRSVSIAEVREVKSPLDIYLRSVTDAMALKKAANVDEIAARMGDERREMAQRWIELCSSPDFNASSRKLLLSLGLREGDSEG